MYIFINIYHIGTVPGFLSNEKEYDLQVVQRVHDTYIYAIIRVPTYIFISYIYIY